LACSTISFADASSARWSYASIRIRILPPCIEPELLATDNRRTHQTLSACPAGPSGGSFGDDDGPPATALRPEKPSKIAPSQSCRTVAAPCRILDRAEK